MESSEQKTEHGGCYLCGNSEFVPRSGRVRVEGPISGDQLPLVVECTNCGLVALDSQHHIQKSHYEESRMHGSLPDTMEEWLQETEVDSQRRFEMLEALLLRSRVLDVGTGAAGFLRKAQDVATEVVGVEPEARVRTFYGDALDLHPNLEALGDKKFDVITAFHVLEHLPDPRSMLTALGTLAAPGGRIVVEVPNSDDALLTLYNCAAFHDFTYRTDHLYLFNAETLRRLIVQAGLRVVAITQCQRFSLSNHLHWLSQQRPGGHQRWSFLESVSLREAYAAALAATGRCDTLIAHLERNPA